MARGNVCGRGPSGARAVLTGAVAALVAALLAVGGVWASPAQAALPAGSTVNGVVAFRGVTVVPTPGGRRALDLLAAAAKGTPGVSVTVTGWAAAPRTTRVVVKLSSLRANYVVAQLRRRGVTANFTARAGGRYPVRGTAGRRADVTITTPAAPPTTPTSAPPTTPTSTPTTLPPAPTAVSISSGRRLSCAVMTDTTARCWGRNDVGQLGNNNAPNDSPVPVTVVDPDNTSRALTGVASISAGFRHTCAVMVDGTARCWGSNIDEGYGQLGNNNAPTDSSVPVKVVDPTNTANPLSGVASISAGLYHTCAVMVDGTARCWGLNDVGQLGDNQASGVNSLVPVKVVDPVNTANPLSGVASIFAGEAHTCAVMTDGTARCWGPNSYGQLGNNDVGGYSSMPVKVVDPVNTADPLSGVASISAGFLHTCAVMTDGTVRCWGYNVSGQIGNNTALNNSLVPVKVVDPVNTADPLSGVASISAGFNHTCAVMTAGTVRCWGYNELGQLGNNNAPNDSPVPVTVVGIP